MEESPDYTERRQHKRASVQNIVVGMLNIGELETIGSITDISLGGVKYTYNELRTAPLKRPIHSIDLIADSNFLFDIPCEYAWENAVETKPQSKLTNLRQCGIQFGKLTLNQIFLLRSFINRCASLRINSVTSNVYMTNS